jgi:hypothetical protein
MQQFFDPPLPLPPHTYQGTFHIFSPIHSVSFHSRSKWFLVQGFIPLLIEFKEDSFIFNPRGIAIFGQEFALGLCKNLSLSNK